MASPWLDHLDDEDTAFIKRFVLASGSLKAMAQAYGVSYPTVRARLNKLIEKVRLADAEAPASAFERTLRMRAADGKVDPRVIAELLKAHREDLAVDAARADGTPAPATKSKATKGAEA
jgi:hypothetical protein